jgi:subtilisin family serine protease
MHPTLRRRSLARGHFLALAVALAWLATGTHGLAAPASDASGTRKLDAHLRHAIDRDGDEVTTRVIIQVEPGAAGSVEAVLKGRGETPVRYHPGIGAFTVRSKHLLALARHSGIKSISIDARLDALQTASAAPTDRIVRASVSIPGTWTGAGVGVAIVDSGIEPSADFTGRISAFYDFTRGGGATTPFDDYGHGTTHWRLRRVE